MTTYRHKHLYTIWHSLCWDLRSSELPHPAPLAHGWAKLPLCRICGVLNTRPVSLWICRHEFTLTGWTRGKCIWSQNILSSASDQISRSILNQIIILLSTYMWAHVRLCEAPDIISRKCVTDGQVVIHYPVAMTGEAPHGYHQFRTAHWKGQ